MANTLTDLIQTTYASMNVVSRELVGFIPSVTRDVRTDRVALNQTVTIPQAPAATSRNRTPGTNVPDDGDQTFTNVTVTITKDKAVPFRWTGDEAESINISGGSHGDMVNGQIMQAYRTITNEMESDLADLYYKASRSYGDGSTPFGTAGDYTDASFARKIVVDNGGPQSGLQMVINTGAGANIRGKQADSNRQGTDQLLRQGVLLDTSGMQIRESAQIVNHTKGTAASATTDTAGYAVGDTVITLASAGTGTILQGDSITFAGDSEQYNVISGDADVSGGGTITLAAPGLRQAIPGSATDITVVGSGFRNMVFSRNAIILAARRPYMVGGRDSAVNRIEVTDPVSGISFDLAEYLEYGRTHWELQAAWGVEMILPNHCAILNG